MALGKAGRLTAESVKPLQSYELFHNCQVAHNRPVFTKRVLALCKLLTSRRQRVKFCQVCKSNQRERTESKSMRRIYIEFKILCQRAFLATRNIFKNCVSSYNNLSER